MMAPESSASEVLANYRRWKEDGEALKARAQSFLMERFSELIREAQQVQHDLWEDFGQTVKFPANPKLARKGKGRSISRKTAPALRPVAEPNIPLAKPNASLAPSIPAPPPRNVASPIALPPAASRKSSRAPLRVGKATPVETHTPEKKRRLLVRQIQKAEARLAQVRTLGDPAKLQNAEDRLYELNDDLRLLDQGE